MTARYVHVATDPSVTEDDALLVYSEAGALQWKACPLDGFGTHGDAQAVAVDPAGNVYIATTNQADIVHKYNAAGVKQWSQHYDDLTDGYAVAVGPDGHVLVGTFRSYFSCGLIDGTTGAVIWTKDTGEHIFAVARDANNVCYVAGARGGGTTAIWTYAADGTPGWTADYGATVWALALDWTGAYLYAAGHHYLGACVRKYDASTGVEVTTGGFPLQYDPVDFISDTNAICTDRTGNIYVAHWGDSDGTNFIKFSSAGTLLWSQSWPDTFAALGIAVTPEGHVYVVGSNRLDLGANVRCYNADTGAEETSGGWPVQMGASGVAVSPGVVGAYPTDWLPTGGGYPGPPGEWPTDGDGADDPDNDGVEDGPGWHDGGGGFPGSPPNIYVGRVDFE